MHEILHVHNIIKLFIILKLQTGVNVVILHCVDGKLMHFKEAYISSGFSLIQSYLVATETVDEISCK